VKFSLTARCLSAAATVVILTVGFAAAASADDVSIDNDITTNAADHSYTVSVAPGATVSTTAQVVVDYQGSNHLLAGSAIIVSQDSVTGGLVPADLVVTPASGSVPAVWTAASPKFGISSSVSFTAPTTPGTYHTNIKYAPTTFTCAPGNSGCLSSGTGDPFSINLTVTGGEGTGTGNSAPAVTFTHPPTATTEGSTETFTFAITDADSADTHTFGTGYPSCGAGNTLGTASIDNTAHTGTFQCTFPDGLVPAIDSTVGVKVTDGTDQSTLTTTDVMVTNVNPSVTAPSFTVTSVNCRIAVNLGAISFSDAGVNDAAWTVDVNWGDGSAHTSFTTSVQGAQANQSHTYNGPGTYSASVTVTDKDSGVGGPTSSSNSIQVLQVYNTAFLPPFDGSSPSKLIANTMKNGRVVPVKVTIFDVCAQAWVPSTASVTIQVTKTSGSASNTPDPVEVFADAGASSGNTSSFRWSADATMASGGFWIYNLDSKALGLIVNNFYRIDIRVGTNLATGSTWGILQPVK
jgi:hypothetical protein